MATHLSTVAIDDGDSVVISGSCDLVVVHCLQSSTNPGTTGTLGGTALSVASNANDFAQILYRLSPASGSQVVDVSTGSAYLVVSQYSGPDTFQDATHANAQTVGRTPTGAGVVVAGISAVSAESGTAGGATTRNSSGTGFWAGDLIVTGSGAITIGVTGSTGDTDICAAVFLDPEDEEANASGTPSIGVITGAGTATVEVSASGTPSIAPITGAGTATVEVEASGSPSTGVVTGAGTVSAIASISGAPSTGVVTGEGTATVEVSLGGTPSIGVITAAGTIFTEDVSNLNGAPSIEAITGAGTATVEIGASGTPSIAPVTAAGTATVTVSASGAPSIGAVTVSGSASVETTRNLAGAAVIGAITAAGTATTVPTSGGTIEVSSTLRENVRTTTRMLEVVTTSESLNEKVRTRDALP